MASYDKAHAIPVNPELGHLTEGMPLQLVQRVNISLGKFDEDSMGCERCLQKFTNIFLELKN